MKGIQITVAYNPNSDACMDLLIRVFRRCVLIEGRYSMARRFFDKNTKSDQ
jgi:hypothetical protein